MKRRTSGLLLSLLMLVSLTACGAEIPGGGSTGLDEAFSTSGSLIDLPVAGPEDISQPDASTRGAASRTASQGFRFFWGLLPRYRLYLISPYYPFASSSSAASRSHSA